MANKIGTLLEKLKPWRRRPSAYQREMVAVQRGSTQFLFHFWKGISSSVLVRGWGEKTQGPQRLYPIRWWRETGEPVRHIRTGGNGGTEGGPSC